MAGIARQKKKKKMVTLEFKVTLQQQWGLAAV